MSIIKTLVAGFFVFSISAFAGIDIAFAAGAISVTEYTDSNFSSIFERMADSFVGAPGLISAAAYITGMLMAISAIIKIKEVVDNPGNVSIREPIARALIAGALFAMPTVVDVATATIGSQTGSVGVRDIALGTDIFGKLMGAAGVSACKAMDVVGVIGGAIGGGAGGGGIGGAIGGGVGAALWGGTIGKAVCYTAYSFSGLSWLIGTILYISGLFLVFWGLLQLRDHLIAPDRAPISAPLKKLLVAGAFFAFPSVLDVVVNSVSDNKDGLIGIDPTLTMACGAGALGGIIAGIGGLFGGGGAPKGGGLDCMMIKLVGDLWSPVQIAVSIFCYLAGIIVVAFALRRMLDNMDKGARSPVGIGTLAMFAVGGALLSIDVIIRSISMSIFGDLFSGFKPVKLQLYGSLTYAPGVGAAGIKSINSVITTVFMFSFLVGIISIVRGLFILKEVSNGGNASLMAGFTHLIGGGLAVNLGPVINAIQNTLGVSSVGLKVSADPFGILP